jgi:hypothetical protein
MVICSEPVFRVFPPDGHQARHFLLGDGNLFAAPFGQREVGDLVGNGVLIQDGSTHSIPRIKES